MHSFKDSRILPYKADFIRDIIIDIEKYPEFLPWCTNSSIISKSEKFMVADLTISFKAFSESYRSKVESTKNADSYVINVEAISGPFKTLMNIWTIEKLNNSCKLNFSIDFEFKSMLLDMLIGTIFSIATDKMINAFESRAIYLANKIVL